MEDGSQIRKKLWFAYLSAMIFWMVLTYGHTFASLAANELFVHADKQEVFLNDFLTYYSDSILCWKSMQTGINIYDPALQLENLKQLAPAIKMNRVFFSQYPPYVMVYYMALKLLPLKLSWLAWITLASCLIAWCIHRLLADTLHGRFTRAFSYLAAFAAYPTWVSIRLGQVVLLAYPFVIGYWLALKKKMWFRAGLLGGFSLVKLQYMPIIFLVGALLGGIRFTAGYVLAGLIYLGVSTAVLGWHTWTSYPQALQYSVAGQDITGVSVNAQQNIRGQLAVLFGGDSSEIRMVATAVWLLTSLLVVYLWWRAKKQGSLYKEVDGADGKSLSVTSNFLLLASSTVLIQLVTSPHTHMQDFTFVSLTCIWLIHAISGDRGSHGPAGMWLKVLLIGFPILSWVFFMSTKFLPPLLQPFFIWAILVLSVIAFLKRGRGCDTTDNAQT